MVLVLIKIFIGIIILLYSGELLVKNSSNLAKKLGLSQFFIGITIVAFATSLPELFISLIAILKNNYEISIGNIIGSNIANLGLVLPFVFLFSREQNKISKLNLFFFILSTLLFYLVSLYGCFIRLFSLVFIIIFLLFMFYSIKKSKDKELASLKENIDNNNLNTNSFAYKEFDFRKKYFINIILIIVSIFGLYFGSSYLVNNGVILAKLLNVSDLLIGITVMAIGTSLPELTASIVAIIRKNLDISIANIIGSNIFNVFFVLPIVAIIKPLKINPSINYIEFPVLIFMSFLLLLYTKKHSFRKYYAVFLILTYIVYVFLFLYRK
jgi:cation:H+ antiporter